MYVSDCGTRKEHIDIDMYIMVIHNNVSEVFVCCVSSLTACFLIHAYEYLNRDEECKRRNCINILIDVYLYI